MFSAKEAAIAVDMIRQFGIPIAVNLTYKYTKDRATGAVIYKTDWGNSAADLLEILSNGDISIKGAQGNVEYLMAARHG